MHSTNIKYWIIDDWVTGAEMQKKREKNEIKNLYAIEKMQVDDII